MQHSGNPATERVPVSAFTGGFLWNRRHRRILELAGYDVRAGLPERRNGLVAVWGNTQNSWRAERVAAWRQVPLLQVEDGFLRSVRTGRSGEPPQGLLIDRKGNYYDCSRACELEDLLNRGSLEADGLPERANALMAQMRSLEISKYNAFDPALPVGDAGYVLVIDQTLGDASIRLGGANAAVFRSMLSAARAENPGKRILIKTHPEVAGGYRRGHFSADDLDADTQLFTAPVSPWRMLDGAASVYAVSSLMGFEAILAGHRPRLFGKPFYGGWGLSQDEQIFQRRDRALSAEALFAGAMLLYPFWYDVYRDRLCEFEVVLDNIEAQARAWREDCQGYSAIGISRWKRPHFRRFFAAAGARLTFAGDPTGAAGQGKRGLVWAGSEDASLRQAFEGAGQQLLRIEDGFLRSRGLGADLVPPLSLVVDDLGIYFDPSRESRLERLLNSSADLSEAARARADALWDRLIKTGLSKYNTGESVGLGQGWPKGKRRILVPGQVEDDASIRFGAAGISRNLDLLAETRRANPDAFIVYKPHPDVEAGLRKGAVDTVEAGRFADLVLDNVHPIAAIAAVDEVWTITSLLGFEALLRGKQVTCLGLPFYAGWGLTRDPDRVLPQRRARPDLTALLHAALIAYPRYFDPLTGLPCPAEVALMRLEAGQSLPRRRLLARLQSRFSGLAPLWRPERKP